ncbi:lytic transglycosylase domain-containing protein [Myxococcus qinghaiensis]|uniref:lytic transglycosylase domain-containing protein n=1 Tax=Myxococcus qinghaiensis TaxID=2906758 RepID=UPI0020A6DB5A|nr:transglycosylase SLT domain-containing protein [Myxococcus qinghaiensis]MCP3166969.1 transglycosylase SLT domain-containing protein [Myxococcus qinghaiensis]
MARKRALGGFSIPWWAWVGLAAVVPVVLINGAISWLGDTHVSPLSLSFLEMKVNALGTYVAHRPSCLLDGHEPLEPLIARAERRHGLPPGLLQALVLVESEGRVHRISPAGAMGPGQLMPTTAVMLGVADPFDPEPALDGSARYLAAQLRRFRDVRLAVAAYNAGPGSVNGRVPRNGETEYYVPKVLTAWVRTRPPEPPRPVPVVAARARPVTAVVAKPVAPVRPAVAQVGKKTVAAKPVAPVRPKVVAKPVAAPARTTVVAKPVAPKAKPKAETAPAKAPARATQAKPAVTVNTRPG